MCSLLSLHSEREGGAHENCHKTRLKYDLCSGVPVHVLKHCVLTTVSPFPPRNGPTLYTRRRYIILVLELPIRDGHTCCTCLKARWVSNFHLCYSYLYRPCSSVLVLTSPSSSVAIVMTTPTRSGSTLPVTLSPGLPRKEGTSSGQSTRCGRTTYMTKT